MGPDDHTCFICLTGDFANEVVVRIYSTDTMTAKIAKTDLVYAIIALDMFCGKRKGKIPTNKKFQKT